MDLTEEIRQRINELNGGHPAILAMAAVVGVAKWPNGEYFYHDAFVAVTPVDVAIFEAKQTGTFRKKVEVRASSRYPLRELRSVGVDRNTEALIFEHDPQEFWLLPTGPKDAWAHLMRTLADAHAGPSQGSAMEAHLRPERSTPLTTWTQVQQYVSANFKVDETDATMMRLTFTIDEDRSQLVFLYRETLRDGQEEWLAIESPIGPVSRIDLKRALEEVGGMVAGALTVRGDFLMLKHSVQISGLDATTFDRPLRLITVTADRLEQLLVGGDAY